jgi:hypothetical protein
LISQSLQTLIAEQYLFSYVSIQNNYSQPVFGWQNKGSAAGTPNNQIGVCGANGITDRGCLWYAPGMGHVGARSGDAGGFLSP